MNTSLGKPHGCLVAQICNLPSRRFVICMRVTRLERVDLPTARRVQLGDTAECNSALPQPANRRMRQAHNLCGFRGRIPKKDDRKSAPFISSTLRAGAWLCALTLLALCAWPGAAATTLFETTSPYHHIRVVDNQGLRTLCFDDGLETCMSLQDPMKGHFEYTEYFHLAWLWKTNLSSALIIGLGGGSVQRSFEFYYPEFKVETVEIDPAVLQVARNYFHFNESDRQKVHVEDGRMFLRRSTAQYDYIILDAYVQSRYGSAIPQHLATKEFFEIVRDHLSTNGLAAYNVIGSTSGWHAEIVGAIYRTLKAVFPQVYIFPAETSRNVVLIATRARIRAELPALRSRAVSMVQGRKIALPGFLARLDRMQYLAPLSAARSPVLTDDYAPVEGLAAAGK